MCLLLSTNVDNTNHIRYVRIIVYKLYSNVQRHVGPPTDVQLKSNLNSDAIPEPEPLWFLQFQIWSKCDFIFLHYFSHFQKTLS